jgi:hypothetical protein
LTGKKRAIFVHSGRRDKRCETQAKSTQMQLTVVQSLPPPKAAFQNLFISPSLM